MTVGETIRELRKKRGLTQKELGIAIGVSKHTVMRYERGETSPTFNILSAIESFFGTSLGYNNDHNSQISTLLKKEDLQYLKLPAGSRASSYYDMMGRKDNLKAWVDKLDYEKLGKVEQLLCLAGMYEPAKSDYRDIQQQSLRSLLGDIPANKIMLPVVGRSAAGLPIEMIEATDEAVAVNGEIRAQPGDFVIIAVGDSMIDAGIRDGDRCLIHPQPQVENGQIALVVIDNGSTIKRFYAEDNGYKLMPCNPKHQPQYYDADAPIRVIGLFLTVIE